MYLNYADYQTMGGTLDEATFNDFEFEAECIIDWYTFNRIRKMKPADYPQRLQEVLPRCMYRLIQLAKLKADLLNSAVGGYGIGWTSTSTPVATTIASQSNDGVSISYNMITASEAFGLLNAKSKGSEIDLTIDRYLGDCVDALGRKLLFRGFYPGE